MKRFIVPAVLVGILAALVGGAIASDKDAATTTTTTTTTKPATSRYLVISPHTPEECLKALDEVSAMGPATLKMYDFGCKAGDHTGYYMINATSEQEALSKVPASIRDKARAVKVSKFTADEIKKLHEQMEKKM